MAEEEKQSAAALDVTSQSSRDAKEESLLKRVDPDAVEMVFNDSAARTDAKTENGEEGDALINSSAPADAGGAAAAAKAASTAGTMGKQLNSKFVDETDAAKINQLLRGLIKSRGEEVLVLSKTWCPFCLETKRTLEDYKIPYEVVEMDLLKGGSTIQKELANINGQKTVPHVYINENHIGGCNAFKTYIGEGKLNDLIGRYRDDDKETKQLERQLYESDANGLVSQNTAAFQALFWFPSTVNGNVVRVLGVQSVIMCILGLVFYEEEFMHWVLFYLFIDYTIRFIGGAAMAPMGVLAALIVSQMTPKFNPGPPKQFAAMCGMMFSGGSALLFRLGAEIPAIVVLCILLVCAFLEGFVDFCVGCYFFGLAVQFKIVPPSVYKLHLNTKDMRKLMYTEAFTRLNQGPYVMKERYVNADVPKKSDLYYKIKSDEQKQEDFHPIRHLRVTMFTLVLGIAALALEWRQMADIDTSGADDTKPFEGINRTVSDVLLTLSFVLFCVVSLLYLARCFLYTKKVIKEFQHPSFVNFFAAIPMNIILFVFLAHDRDVLNDDENDDVRRFYDNIFWICAVSVMLLSVHVNALWFSRRLGVENVDPSWLFLPLACFVCVVVGVSLDSDEFTDELWFWFGAGSLFTVVLMPLTMYKVIIGANPDPRGRNSVAIWCAVPPFAALAYETLEGLNDLSLALYWSGVYLACVLFVLFLYRFLGGAKFDQTYYAYGFALSAVAIGSIRLNYYADYINGEMHAHRIGSIMYHVLAYACIGAANIAVFVAFVHTLVGIAQRRVLRPVLPKWGVLSFMRLTHEAIRGWMQRMQILLNEDELNLKLITAEWNVGSMIHHEHAQHEDKVIYHDVRVLFPGFTDVADEDHEHHEVQMKEMNELLEKMNAQGVEKEEMNGLKKELITKMNEYMEGMEEHLLWEEAHLQPPIKKYMPIGLHKNVLEKVWDYTHYDKWRVIIPWIVRNIPKLPQRVLFLKTLTWAMPYRCQQIGIIVYRGCDDVVWADIAQQMPEMIPRGVQGWRRQYF